MSFVARIVVRGKDGCIFQMRPVGQGQPVAVVVVYIGDVSVLTELAVLEQRGLLWDEVSDACFLQAGIESVMREDVKIPEPSIRFRIDIPTAEE